MREHKPLTEEQLKALDKLEGLASKELEKIPYTYNVYHDPKFQKLSNVSGWVQTVKHTHENPYCWSETESALSALRDIVREFKFKL